MDNGIEFPGQATAQAQPAFTAEQVLVFRAARALADRVFALLSEMGGSSDPRAARVAWLEDWRGESANPFYNQTSRGLFLEIYYSLPNKVWTPWGAWSFGGSGSGGMSAVAERLLVECGAEIHEPRTTSYMGVHGPVYRLRRVCGVELPEATVRPRDQYLSYEDAGSEWRALVERHAEVASLAAVRFAVKNQESQGG